ncbi:MAG: response regulator [Candidatus Omnitrophica bacterium]|nr:response regulator [Candidatus Omnitrophota bacterium]
MNQKVSKKILIVDDEEGIRESLKLVLADHYNLIIADSPEQALECLKHDKTIALAFLDIKMPQINGLDVLKQMKELRKDVKVVMVTGYKSVETASEAARLGADGYIVKPFKVEEILKAVTKLIA